MSPAPGTPGLVIVGGGIAGQSLAERVRELDRDRPVTILAAEKRAPRGFVLEFLKFFRS